MFIENPGESGKQWESVWVRRSPDRGAEEHGTKEQGNMVSRVGLNSSSERRIKQRGHKMTQTVQGLLRSGHDRLENRG